MRKPAAVVDRQGEWRELVRAWERAGAELIFVVGRRRVGKSFLLTHFARKVGGLYYQATRRTAREQLAVLSGVMGEHFRDPALEHGVVFPDWESVFRYVVRRSGGEPFLMVLDEFPYLADADPAFPSVLQALWDQEIAASRMKLILSGSYVTAMKRLEEPDRPLYGRRTGRITLRPFDHGDAARFFAAYSPEDRLVAYGAFGGLPGALTPVDAARSVAENVAEHMLAPAGRLVDEAQHMLDAFVADATLHYSVLEAMARGERTWGGISKRVGRTGGALHRSLLWLEDMELVSRVVPVTERSPAKSKRAVYRLADPYLAFWHRFVSPLLATGSIGMVEPSRLWNVYIAPELDGYMGRVFEGACRDFVLRSALPFAPLRVGEWWDARSENEVDLVALGEDGEVLVGECKWGAVRAADLERLRRRAQLLIAELHGGVRTLHFALFSARSEGDAEVRARVKAGEVLFFTAADLFERGA